MMPRKMLNFSAVLALAFASGCTRTTLVPESSPLRIARPVEARVYVLQDDGTWRESETVIVPEGFYLVPPSFVESESDNR